MTRYLTIIAGALAACIAAPVAAGQAAIGSDAAACDQHEGPAIRVEVTGLKDRKGRLKLELYPATEEDFLKNDTALIAEGKTFRRVWADTPTAGPVAICIKVPRPGRYALFFTHDRDNKNKFNFWADGGGVPGNVRMGRARPKLETAVVDVTDGVITTHIRTQYLRGLGGFAPSKADQ